MQCNANNRHRCKNHIKLATRSLATFSQNPPLEKMIVNQIADSDIHTVLSIRFPMDFIFLTFIHPVSYHTCVKFALFLHRLFFFIRYSHKYGCKPAGKIILNFKLIVRFIIKTFIFAIILDCSQICWCVYINRLNRLDVISGGFIFFRV